MNRSFGLDQGGEFEDFKTSVRKHLGEFGSFDVLLLHPGYPLDYAAGWKAATSKARIWRAEEGVEERVVDEKAIREAVEEVFKLGGKDREMRADELRGLGSSIIYLFVKESQPPDRGGFRWASLRIWLTKNPPEEIAKLFAAIFGSVAPAADDPWR